MSYPPIEPTNVNEPTDLRLAKYGAEELRALKAYIQTEIVPKLVAPGSIKSVPPGVILPYTSPVAPAGFILLPSNLTSDFSAIGNATSGASVYAAADALELYKVLWQNPTVKIYTNVGTLTTKGADATADFNASKGLSLPQMSGRVPVFPSAGKTPNSTLGADSVTLTVAKLPAHKHRLKITSGAVAGELKGWADGGNPTSSGGSTPGFADSAHMETTGSGEAIDITPASFVPYWIIAK